MRRVFQPFLNLRQLFRGPAIAPATADILAFLDASGGMKLGRTTFADVLALSPPGLALIQAQNPSGVATLDFTTGINSTYENYLVIGHLIPATDDVQLWVRMDADGGASFDAGASDYGWTCNGRVAGSSGDGNNDSDAQIVLFADAGAGFAVGNATTEGVFFCLTLYRPANAAVFTAIGGAYSFIDSAARGGAGAMHGRRRAAQADNALRFLFESGNIASGHVALYGLKKA